VRERVLREREREREERERVFVGERERVTCLVHISYILSSSSHLREVEREAYIIIIIYYYITYILYLRGERRVKSAVRGEPKRVRAAASILCYISICYLYSFAQGYMPI